VFPVLSAPRLYYQGPGLPARSQFASGSSCDRPTRSRFSVVFFDPKANAELVPKFHVALHASHAALLLVTSKFSPNIAPPTFAQILLYCSPPIICVTYSRRTSRHCLGTFKTGDIRSFLPPQI
jgi:hypothetical protein